MTHQPASVHILLVDDNPTNLKVLSEAIRDQGWQILVATDGESAIEQIRYMPPDLILLDVMMPGIDGFETCRRLKTDPTTEPIPVIFMTALSDTIDKVKGLELGAVDYVTKPFQRDEVIARVRVHLKLCYLTRTLSGQNQRLMEEVNKRQHAEADLVQLNQALEQRVMARTAELSDSLHQLQQAQSQLIQSEKMSALGQLVAGVAHEINNPVGFITNNLHELRSYTEDLLEHLRLYQKIYAPIDDRLQTHACEIDLEFLQQDLPKLLASMQTGTERIAHISTSLRTFSRSDMQHKVEFNLHDGIDSTLMILGHRLKANEHRPAIAILKEYGELPLVNCYPGQLNQVFMNILANAIDALEEHSQGQSFEQLEESPNHITIHTEANHHTVKISIGDNGSGIAADLQAKVFEHLFTTKRVGQGTGLGLFISREIVEQKHQGRLHCISSLGQGTEFVIELPIESAPDRVNFE